MKKYLVEFAFAENCTAVNEWNTLDVFEAENAEEAAKEAACTDGLENALFKVQELQKNDFDQDEKVGEAEYFSF